VRIRVEFPGEAAGTIVPPGGACPGPRGRPRHRGARPFRPAV